MKLWETAGDLSKVVGASENICVILAMPAAENDQIKGLEHIHREPNKKNNSPLPVFTKKENATLSQHIEILDQALMHSVCIQDVHIVY